MGLPRPMPRGRRVRRFTGSRLNSILLTIALLSALGCAAGRSSSAEASSAGEAAIMREFRASADAWNEGDLAGHLAIYTDDVTFMTGDGPVRGVASIEQAFRQSYWRDGRPVQALRFEQVEIEMLNAGSALQTGRFILSGGGGPEQTGWFSLVWVLTDEGWRAVHDHTS